MKYTVSFGAIVKNEGLYLTEWLRFHRWLGVEHFYIYENDSTDDTFEVLSRENFSHSDITIGRISGCPAQKRAYEAIIHDYKDETEWLGFFDIDEFFCPKVNYRNCLPVTLYPYRRYSAVAFHWYLFGSNHREVYTPEPVVERFTYRQADGNTHTKRFVNPRLTGDFWTAHSFKVLKGMVVDEGCNPIPAIESNPALNKSSYTIGQVNHYVTKSLEECTKRRAYSRSDILEVRKMPDFFLSHDRNDVEDLTARDIWRAFA